MQFSDLSTREQLRWMLVFPVVGLVVLSTYLLLSEYHAAQLTNDYPYFYTFAAALTISLGFLFAATLWEMSRLTAALKILHTDASNQQQAIDNYQLLSGELQQVFSMLSSGVSSQTVTGAYAGDLLLLKQTVNESVVKLNTSMAEIRTVIHAATQGVLNKRVDLNGKQGFFHELGENLNHNLDMNQQLVEEVMRVFAAVAVGDLSQTMTQNYAGTLAQLKQAINESVTKLNVSMTEVRVVIHSAVQGVLDKRVDLGGKQGFFHELGENLNCNFDMNQRLIEELMRVLGAVAAGELNQTMTQSYPGVLAQLKQTTNDSVAKLNTSMVEIRGAIHAAAQGVLDKRVDLGGKQGFFHELGENLNHNLDMNQQLVEEVMRVFAAVAVGDLSQTMTQNYAGTLAQLKADVNISIGKLSNVMHEIRDSINAAGQGIFDRRIDLNNKAGFFRDVSENLNRNLDTNQKMVEELMRIFAAMANGDLSQSMQDGYLGKLAELKKDVNSTIAKLNQLFEELIRVFSAMSTGDLTQNIHQDYTGRLAELKRDVMDTLTKLNQVVGGVGQASKQVHAASEEVSHGTLSLSERTEEQAAALEETSSSMQEMTDTVQRNSDNAQEANLLSINARKHAEEGSKVVGTAIVAISEINKSSRRMSDIISVIDEIAFQTNLLALNAAVEAARAGEQGRGFAVVATEVRNLAQRSSAAAKEIKGLIQDTMNKIEDGTQAVNQSGQTLEEIVLSTKKVSDIVAEIAAANQEQSAGILQVNKAVTQMDEMTEQNAALVEELSGNSESMREQAGTLNQLLDFFKSEGNEQHRSKLIQNSPQHDGETPPSTVRRHQEVDHHTTKPTATRPKKKSGNSSYSHPMSAAQRHEADKETEWENF